MRVGWGLLVVGLLFPGVGFGQVAMGPGVDAAGLTPLAVVKAMIAHEDDNAAHRDECGFNARRRRSNRIGRVGMFGRSGWWRLRLGG